MRYFYILGTLLFTVYGQMILKWRLNSIGFQLPDGALWHKIKALITMIIDPFILSGFAAAFIASMFWMAAMSKFEITQAYPFMSLAPAIVFILGVALLNETFTWGKVAGLILIIIGTIVTVRY